METVTEETLYKIVRKKDSHVNTKLNSDGSKSAIQFTNDGNVLNGPVNLIEVDEKDFLRTEYVPMQDEPRTFNEIIWQDVIAPMMQEFLYQAMMEGYDSLCNQLKTKVVPVLKTKSKGIIKDVGIITSVIKDSFTGSPPKVLELMNENVIVESNNHSSRVDMPQKTVRSKEELEQIVCTMKSSAVTLAACIKILNNSVMADDGTDPQLRIVIQQNLQVLSTSDVMQQINWLLEDKNKALLDDAEFKMLSSFKEGYLLTNKSKVPIAKYLDKQEGGLCGERMDMGR